ncbi:RNA-binding protein 14 [Latimeria chalumnae]|uniref:RNA-binding protein 14 n=1 Tax=Latimeria chalumnae TaxID=7897 RepID=UPI00313C358D
MKIFIGNLSSKTREKDVSVLFEPYGTVQSCAVLNQYAFVHMKEVEAGKRAVRELNGTELHGNALVVEESRRRPLNTVKIFVGNISSAVTSKELEAEFRPFGKIVECDILKEFGFVHMENEEEAMNAIMALNRTPLKGKTISVQLSTSNKKPFGSPGTPRNQGDRQSGLSRGRPHGASGPPRNQGDRPYGSFGSPRNLGDRAMPSRSLDDRAMPQRSQSDRSMPSWNLDDQTLGSSGAQRDYGDDGSFESLGAARSLDDRVYVPPRDQGDDWRYASVSRQQPNPSKNGSYEDKYNSASLQSTSPGTSYAPRNSYSESDYSIRYSYYPDQYGSSQEGGHTLPSTYGRDRSPIRRSVPSLPPVSSTSLASSSLSRPLAPSAPSEFSRPLAPSAPSEFSRPLAPSEFSRPLAPSEFSRPLAPSAPSEFSRPLAPSAPSEFLRPLAPSAPSEFSRPLAPSEFSRPLAPSEFSRPLTPSEFSRPLAPSEFSRPLAASAPSEFSRPLAASAPSEFSRPLAPSAPSEFSRPLAPSDFSRPLALSSASELSKSLAPSASTGLPYERTRLSPPRISSARSDSKRFSYDSISRYSYDRPVTGLSDYRRYPETDSAYRRPSESPLEYRSYAESSSGYSRLAEPRSDFRRTLDPPPLSSQHSDYQRRSLGDDRLSQMDSMRYRR